jgi:hypothetical protein
VTERDPFNYDKIHYNNLKYRIKKKWNGYDLTEHEFNIAILAYQLGRLDEAECEIKIVEAAK